MTAVKLETGVSLPGTRCLRFPEGFHILIRTPNWLNRLLHCTQFTALPPRLLHALSMQCRPDPVLFALACTTGKKQLARQIRFL
ncbi:MAG: hypothetical protein ED559_08955 [Phycisphaera sp.]|nr:MAG: hypothetical protein ED559_08955 [Phycisphaera sp.]